MSIFNSSKSSQAAAALGAARASIEMFTTPIQTVNTKLSFLPFNLHRLRFLLIEFLFRNKHQNEYRSKIIKWDRRAWHRGNEGRWEMLILLLPCSVLLLFCYTTAYVALTRSLEVETLFGSDIGCLFVCGNNALLLLEFSFFLLPLYSIWLEQSPIWKCEKDEREWTNN